VTKQETRELIDEVGNQIAKIVFWVGMTYFAIVFGWPYLEAHNEHGRPVFEAAEKGDDSAIELIRDASKGDCLALWVLGESCRK
jgi:hypothetical protein